MFDLRNNATVAPLKLRPLGGPWAFFRRFMVFVGGTLVEDIDYYNRTHQMFNQLTAQDSRNNKFLEGLGDEMDILEVAERMSYGDRDNNQAPTVYSGIPGNQSKTCLFKPLSGLFSQNRYLPLKYCGPIVLELEVVSNPKDPIMNIDPSKTSPRDDVNYFTATNTSESWQIEKVQVKCDVCTLDNHVEHIFTQHMLNGCSFPISYNAYISQTQPIAAQTAVVMVNINRSASRLKSCFISFNNNSGSGEFIRANRIWNEFWSPKSGAQNANFVYDKTKEIDTVYVQIGSRRYPEFPITSHAEAFYQLTKCLGIQASDLHNVDINLLQYHSHKFIMGIDLEKVLEAAGTGMNTRVGDLLTVYYKQKSTTSTPNLIHTVLVSENILKRSDVGIEVYD
jgi:hypothetical protein